VTSMEKKQPPTDDERQVLDYLKKHPDFFKAHPDILEQLYLPHPSGAAVSLVEKQLSVLRERNTELRTQLNDLIERSKANDSLFAKSRKLIQALVAARDLSSVIIALNRSFRDEFGIEFHSLTLLDCDPALTGVNCLPRAKAQEHLNLILDSDSAICGALRSQQLIALFGDNAKRIGSAVALRLAHNREPYGILAMGSSDSHYYQSGMDTLFLRFLADILHEVLLPRLPEAP